MKKLIILLLMATCAMGASAQATANETKPAAQDPDSLYAKSLLPAGSDAPTFPELKKGVWTVIDFWATWCGDCRREMPTVRQLYGEYGTKFHFVGVSFDTEKEKLDKYVKENGVSWTQYSEFKKWKETSISKAYNISWIPTMYLVSPDGKVAYATVLAERMGQKLAQLVADGIVK